MHSRTQRPLLIGGAAALSALAISLGGAATANAHVTVSSNTAEADSYAVLTFSVPHGCDGSATTAVAIQIPEGINSATPTRNPFYTVENVNEPLATPITDSHGNQITERVAEIVYTATTPLPDGQRDTFELSLKLPENAAGTTLHFPAVQTCEQGETAWVEVPAAGQDPSELDSPAPELVVVAASTADGQVHDASAHDTTQAVAQPSDSSQTPLIVTSLGIGALGLITGVVALARGRRQA